MEEMKLQGFAPTPPIEREREKIAFKLHTIIMLVGPDGCGKTQFVMEQLMLQLKMAQTARKKISISSINLDQIYYELLDDQTILKNSIEYRRVTDQAHNVFSNKIKNFASYPVTSDFIIIDSNGLDVSIRAEVLRLAEEMHYDVAVLAFNYADKAEYMIADHASGEKKRPNPFQIKEMRVLMSGGLPKKDFSSFIQITSRDFDKYEISVENYADYDQYILPDKQFIIIGDIHGCLDELKALLIKNGFEIDSQDKVSHPQGKGVVLVGDVIDKGYNIKGVVEFIHTNIDFFYVVIGNHENFVHRAISGLLKKSDIPSQEIVDAYFDSVQIFEEDEVLKNKFLTIFQAMKYFYVHRDFIVTHVSCPSKYLGKISSAALKACRDFRVPKLEEVLRESANHPDEKVLDFNMFIQMFDERVQAVKDDANDFHPIHVFGHVETKEISRFKNKIDIDTACVVGGCLTSIEIGVHGIITSQSVPAGEKTKEKDEYTFNFFA